MDNNKYIYVVFRHRRAIVDYDDDGTFLDIILKTEEKAKEYIKS